MRTTCIWCHQEIDVDDDGYVNGVRGNPDCWDAPRRPCQQCGSNGEDDPGCDECDDTGNSWMGIHAVLSNAAKAVIAGLVAPSDDVNHDGITAEDDVWAEIHAVFPLELFTNRPDTVGYNPDASE